MRFIHTLQIFYLKNSVPVEGKGLEQDVASRHSAVIHYQKNAGALVIVHCSNASQVCKTHHNSDILLVTNSTNKQSNMIISPLLDQKVLNEKEKYCLSYSFSTMSLVFLTPSVCFHKSPPTNLQPCLSERTSAQEKTLGSVYHHLRD